MTTGRVERSAEVSIYYEMTGNGPAVVLVAGLGDDRTSWAAQTPELAVDHLVVTIDNRGIGNSSIPPGPYSIGEMADDVHAVVDALGLAPVDAVGSSMGGAICQQWALRHPSDISRLVLTNTWAQRDRFLDALFTHWIRLGENNASARVMESLLLFSHDADYLATHPSVAREFLSLEPPPMRGFVGAAYACRHHDSLDQLDTITQPALVIAGEYDILTRPALSHRLVEALPHATFESLPTGHMVFWEEPDAFTALVREFLRQPN